ncbi:hypothetical protein GCM10007205_10100 [Oxalicibacterium flavum]|uniref:GAF domain-containing protein n=1 Tax=Oxalicibacterium flavum TaxID=179467 RepID=A0A8J2XYW5_9BURK|nr:GAF domain-containing protein [Oxalicibacterium flavum]GGC02901.1 hypothetical protein GCM10007205_10100 [Oxalicibacterium flavum]
MSGQTATQFERIERIGKHLFGVAACVLVLPESQHGRQQTPAHVFCAQPALPDDLQILPEKQTPFQPALGQVGQIEVRFQLRQPLRDASGTVVGLLGLLHDRPRAFTAGDRELLADLLALAEREWHLSSSSSGAGSVAR